MEGSAPKGAATSMNDGVMNGNGSNPMQGVPVPGADDTAGASTSPPPSAGPAQHPVEAALMAEMVDTRKEIRKLLASNRTMAMMLFCIGLCCIYYLATKLKAKIPDASPVRPTVVG